MRSREHSLFTEAEEKAMAKRLAGDYSDPTGIFTNNVRPKLKEIQAWNTPEMRARIKKLEQYQRRVSDPEPAAPNEEKTFTEFSKEIGY
jgi:hypothetical protein